MNVKHYTVGVGLWIQSKYQRAFRANRRRYNELAVKAKENNVGRKVTASAAFVILAANAISATLFLASLGNKALKRKHNHGV